jgi:uncharacterized protein YdeI (YjbR/CyaY-like superfamily)
MATITPTKIFESSRQWRQWLTKYHGTSSGVWLRIFKKDSDMATISYAEALDEALCFGWIDGQKNKYDEVSWLQKFTPRRSKSMWSKRNREHVARLIKEKRMMPAGSAQVEAAKKDGRWGKAYDASSSMTVPVDFLEELKRDRDAYTFFKSLNRANTYAIAWRLHTAKKPETRERRKKQLLGMMKKRERLH